MPVLNVSGYNDYRTQTLLGIDQIVMTGGSDYPYSNTAVFLSSQFGGGGISNSVAISGRDTVTFGSQPPSPVSDNIEVFVAAGAVFSAAGWTFSIWNPVYDKVMLTGTASAETITGANVATTISGGGGADVLMGGTADDTFLFNSELSENATSVNGGGGFDRLLLTINSSVPSALARSDFTTSTLSSIEELRFDFEYDGRLIKATFNNTQFGSGAISKISGGVVDLTIVGGSINLNTIDLTGFGFGFIRLFGNNGDDLLGANINNQWALYEISGGQGNDTLVGGALADTLSGGAGADSLSGGGDHDTFIMGDDNASDTVDGGGDNADPARAAEIYRFLDLVDYSAFSSALTIDLSGGFARLTGAPAGAAFDTLIRINAVIAGAGNDSIVGTARYDWLVGGAGNDTIIGGDSTVYYYHDDTLDGGEGADSLFGGQGPDLFIMTDDNAADTVDGGGDGVGFPTDWQRNSVDYSRFSADLTIDLTAGFGGVTGGSAATRDVLMNIHGITGGSGSDLLIGSALDDLIFGAAPYAVDGHNTIDGGAGNDDIRVWTGGHTLRGGDGSDTIFGGRDCTFIADDDGDIDLFYGLGAVDYSSFTTSLTIDLNAGQAGLDIFTRYYDPTVPGMTDAIAGSGDDILNGSNADNDLNGGAGNDQIFAGPGSDVLIGGLGNDVLDGGAGDDTMTGGDGNEVYAVDSAGDIVIEGAGAGSGYDAVVAYINYTLTDNVEQLVMRGGATMGTGNAWNNYLYGALSALSLKLDGVGGDDLIYGGDGNDTLDGGAGNDTLFGQGGDNTMRGGSGSDSMNGGAGATLFIMDDDGVVDFVNGGSTGWQRVDYSAFSNALTIDLASGVAPDQLTGINAVTTGSGDDLINGTNAANSFDGGAGNDQIFAGAGNDVLTGGLGNDVLDGGAGDDTMTGGDGSEVYAVDSAGDAVIEGAGAGSGYDAVVAYVNYTLTDNVEQLVLRDGATIGTGNAGANYLYGGLSALSLNLDGAGGDDVIYSGLAGGNTLSGGAGVDTLLIYGGNNQANGGLGSDIYYTYSTTDVLSEAGGDGIDTVYSNHSITLGAGFEQLILFGAATTATGSADNNIIYGNSTTGAVSIQGLGGADVLYGGAGNDTLEGGDGVDLLFGLGGANTLIGGNDTDVYYLETAGNTIIETAGGGFDTIYSNVAGVTTLAANVEQLILYGAATGGTGTSGNDYIYANAAAAGVTLDGGAGADYLLGSSQADVLIGGQGDDQIDLSTGGNDAVRYDTAGNMGADILYVFDANPAGGQDVIDVTGLGFTAGGIGSTIILTASGADTFISFGAGTALAGTTIRLIGVAAANVTAADFVF